MSRLSVEVVQGEGGLSDLRQEWSELFVNSSAPPFLSWEWIAVWNTWYGTNQSPYVICVRDREILVGLLALNKSTIAMTPFRLKLKKLSFLAGNFGGADYLDMLAAPGRQQECAIVILDFLLRSKSFDVFELNDLSASSPLVPLLFSHFGNRDEYGYQLIPRFVCPRVNLQSGWNQVLRGSKRADNFKRRLRNLASRDGFSYRSITDAEEIPAAFERFLQLHEACWAHRGGSGAFYDQTSYQFQRAVVNQAARASLIRFDELWVEGRCRASIYGLDNGHTYYFFLSGYDMGWSSQSVGLVLLGLSLENAVKRGVKVYDFLRGAEPYKFDWANDSQITMGVRITSDRMVARWAISGSYVKEAMRTLRSRKVSQGFRTFRRRLRISQGNGPIPDSADMGSGEPPANGAKRFPTLFPSASVSKE